MLQRTLPSLMLCTLCACASAPPEPPVTGAPNTAPATRAETTPQVETPGPARVATDGCDWRVQDGRAQGPGADEDEGYTQSITAVDLDGQAPEELIANVGGCGNRGDCMFVLLQACDATSYRALWGPDYAQALTLEPRAPEQGFATLVVDGRTGKTGCDLPLRQRFTWSQGRWEALAPQCAGPSSVWDDADCGPRPHACASW